MPQPHLDVRPERPTQLRWMGGFGTPAAGLRTDRTFTVTPPGGTPVGLSSHVASSRPDKTRGPA